MILACLSERVWALRLALGNSTLLLTPLSFDLNSYSGFTTLCIYLAPAE